MNEPASRALSDWANFYVITGTAAAALTGLMFVVITLVASNRPRNATRRAISTFSTPTVVHFCVALLISAVMAVPWRSLVPAALILAIAGLYGIVYTARITRNILRVRETYEAEVDDWIWYVILPFVAYIAMFAGAWFLPSLPVRPLFALAGATVLLISIGIHNAWDVVTFIAVVQPQQERGSNESEKAE